MNELIQVGQLEGKHEQSNRVYSEDGICPTIMAGERKSCTGGYVSPKIMVKENDIKLGNKGVIEDMDKIIRVGQVSNQGSQAGMVYDVEGVFPTVCACTHGYAIGNILDNQCSTTKVSKLNQIGYVDKNAQGQRVYDIELSPTLKSNGGGISGASGLHIMGNNKLMNKGADSMWNNNLEKFNFKMEEIRIFDIFAGIGALHQSLKELGVPVRVTNLSEIDIDATISYAAGHINNFKDLEFEYPSVEEMRQWLIDRNIGYSFEKNKSSVPRMKVEKLKLAYKANVLLNNLGDISKINYDEIEDFDLMNMSFCCQDLSNSGKQRGMKNEDGTPTRSGLYVYSIEAVRVKKPKYIMIENVKGLIQKKFIDDFYSIISELEEIGYNCYYPTKEDKKGNKLPACLNSKDFGIAQNRERIFVIAIRKDIDTKTFEFPIGKDHGVRLKHMLEDQVDEKYYLSDEIQKRFKLNSKSSDNKNDIIKVGDIPKEVLNDNERQRRVYSIEGISPTTLARTDNAKIIQNGAIRGRYNSEGKIEQQLELRNDGVTNTLTTVEKDNVIVEDTNKLNMLGMLDIKGNDCIRRVYGDDGLCPTITTMEGGNRQPKIESNFRIRKLTPLECWRLQGFRDESFYKAQELGVSDSQLYKQAGNSITVNVLYYIFKNLFKEYITK